ncbi:alpha/beta fold hydrolase [Ottowia thiooxydans]|uniref:alpha/beta fold hydrolase n=1 Tax=Ottowia thiooxydans TaxID=219182 RepID=UPI0004148B69|nr:alpha/beta hydrolase [Ottowia thiooxydans]
MTTLLKSREFTVNGLRARVQGQGRRVVFVHGVGSYLESWDGVMAEMGAGTEGLAFDLRGHGRSERTPGPYSLTGFCEDLRSLVDHCAWDQFDLVGFSLGGLIAQACALQMPDRLATLTIVSSVAGRTPEEAERARQRSQSLADLGPLAHLSGSVDRWFSDDFRRQHPEVVEERIARSKDMDGRCFSDAYEVLANNDLIDRLHEIHIPTLVMTGEHDVGSNPRMAKRMGESIRGAEVHILAGLRHSVLIEAPHLVGGLLREFHARHPR